MAGWWLLAAWGLTWTLTAAQECSRYGPRKSCGELTGLALPVLSDLLTAPGERPWERRSRWCHSHARPAAGPPDIIEEKCRAQGCCWDPLKTRDPHIDLADCFFANNGRSDYQLVHSEQQGMLFTAVPAMQGTIQHCSWFQSHALHRLQGLRVADGVCISAAVVAAAGVCGPADLATRTCMARQMRAGRTSCVAAAPLYADEH